jgi:protein phosphatase inhibitor 2
MDVVDDHKMSENLISEGVASSPSADEDDRNRAASQTMSPSRRAKPALKKHQMAPPETAAASSSSSTHHPGEGGDAKHLKWDEKAIEEHDLLRGTRMKIDEPNTPYTHYDSGAESDDSRRAKSPANQKPTLSWDVLQNRLDSVAAVRDAYPSSPSSHHETDQSDAEQHEFDDDDTDNNNGGGGGGGGKKDEMRQLEFKEHRKRHYNEMELVRKYRQEHPEGVDVDDAEGVDDDDDLDANRSGDDADNENED